MLFLKGFRNSTYSTRTIPLQLIVWPHISCLTWLRRQRAISTLQSTDDRHKAYSLIRRQRPEESCVLTKTTGESLQFTPIQLKKPPKAHREEKFSSNLGGLPRRSWGRSMCGFARQDFSRPRCPVRSCCEKKSWRKKTWKMVMNHGKKGGWSFGCWPPLSDSGEWRFSGSSYWIRNNPGGYWHPRRGSGEI